MSDGPIYDKSNMPVAGRPGMPVPDRAKDQSGTGPVSGETADDLNFPSLAVQGMTLVRLPLRNCATTVRKCEQYQLRELPRIIAERVDRALGTPEAPLEFSHFCGALKGAGVLGERTQRRMDELAADFAKIPPGERQEEFYERQIAPWLETLKVGPK